jgi:putative ABC transport system permease protein
MTLTRLVLAYVRRRPLSTLLVVLLLALGVATIALTLLVTSTLEARLHRDAAGIDLVVGAKGSPLQLVLAGVYHVDVPPGNIPLSSVAMLRANRMVREAIPLALGDSYRGFRIVGTEPPFIALYGGALAEGTMWRAPMEAVLGAEVARAARAGPGGTFAGAHGLGAGGGEHGDRPYRVVGVLATTGTVLDRLVLTSLDSVWSVHDVHHGAAPGANADTSPVSAADADPDHDHDAAREPDNKASAATIDTKVGTATPPAATPAAPREVTLVLVRYASPVAAASLPRAINSESALVAASPAYETARLLTVFGVGIDLVRAFAVLLVAASTLMLFVALAQALEERRYDLAILRALGARRAQVAFVLLAESLLLTTVGTVFGLALAHGLAALAAATVPQAASLAVAARTFAPAEWAIAGLALVAGILAALWPAWRAWRLDVAATLADG